MDRTVLIIGGSGFVGRNLVEELRTNEEEFTIVVSSRKEVNIAGIQHLQWDLFSDDFPDINADIIVHAATPASADLNVRQPLQMFWQNVNAMKRVLELAGRFKSPPLVLFTSSGGVYGEMPDGKEKFPECYEGAASTLNSRSAYAEGKRVAEFLLTEASSRGSCRSVIARLFAFSGAYLPIDRHFAVGNFVRDALNQHRILVHGDGSGIRSYLDGSDLARWLRASFDHEEPGFALHIGSERAVSIAELARTVAERAKIFNEYDGGVDVLGVMKETDGVNRYVPETIRTRELLNVSETVTLEDSIDIMLRRNSRVFSGEVK